MSSESKPPATGHEREVFLGAVAITDPGERAAFLAAACREDNVLRRRVEGLLQSEGEVGRFLEVPAVAGGSHAAAGTARGPHDTAVRALVTEQPGERIGRYKLLQKIGEGGAGVVYMAEQEEPVRRRVALKIIKLGMDTKQIIARFEAERQALAMMDHPNIAKVLDAGATETGRPYFVMELVRGIKITDYCDQNKLPTADRLRLFIQVCQSIQHAHQKGIIHRDIKPSNILVTLHDGTPVPKVIDFGIAKATEHRLTDKTLFTEFALFIGTPAYMSPEQAELSGLDIDTRSDIYALGVLLYELLTGLTPFDAETLHQASLDECRRTIREKEPDRPSTRLSTLIEADLTTTAQQRAIPSPQLIHLLRGDLDWIVMTCLEKDRTRRYATANALATDVQRYLDNEPVLARPPSNWYRLEKLLHKHRRAFAAVAAIVLTLIAGAGVSIWQAVRATLAERDALVAKQQESFLRQEAERERAMAVQERASARLNEYVADINLAKQSLVAGNLGRAVQLLEKHVPHGNEPDLRGFEWRYLRQLCQGDEHAVLATSSGPVHALAHSPTDAVLASGAFRETTIWDLRTSSVITNIPKGGHSLAFFPDGRLLVTASPTTARIWHTTDWTEAHALPRNGAPIALSADGTRLATMSREGVRVWDTATWKELRRLPARGPMAFDPAGNRLAADTRAGLTLWSLTDEQPGLVLHNATNIFARGGPWFRSDHVMAFSPDGTKLVAARNTLSERGVFVIGIWDARTGRELAGMPDDPEHIEHTGVISALAFSPDGRQLATASMDYSIRLWDFATRKRLATFQGHLSEVWSVAFSPDGRILISGDKDGRVHLWPIRPQPKEDLIAGPWQPLAFSPDSRTLAAFGPDDTLAFLDLSTREPEQQFQLERRRGRFGPRGWEVALSADLSTIAEALPQGKVRLWNTDTGEQDVVQVSDRPVQFIAVSADGQEMITGGRFQPWRWWSRHRGTNTIMDTEARRVIFSPDQRTVAAFARENQIELWDVATRSLRTNIVSASRPGFDAAFSPDGQLLAVVCFDDSIRLWDVATGELAGVCVGHKQAVFSVAFSPDGKTLATASEDSTLKLWNVATQQELLTIRRLGGALRNLAFSPDGQLLVGGSSVFASPGGLRFYHAAPVPTTTSGRSARSRTGRR